MHQKNASKESAAKKTHEKLMKRLARQLAVFTEFDNAAPVNLDGSFLLATRRLAGQKATAISVKSLNYFID